MGGPGSGRRPGFGKGKSTTVSVNGKKKTISIPAARRAVLKDRSKISKHATGVNVFKHLKRISLKNRYSVGV